MGKRKTDSPSTPKSVFGVGSESMFGVGSEFLVLVGSESVLEVS